jgi:hypothetical protein
MNIEKASVTLLVALTFCGAGTSEGKDSHSSEQLQFSAADAGVDRPVPMPQGVWNVLRTDELVRDTLKGEDISPEKIPLSWFSVSAIHLSSSKKVDFVVMGEGPLRGANVIPFWVFCATARGYAMVLTAPAFELDVKNTRWKGHRDIELSSLTAVQMSTVSLRFDGERYVEYRSTSEPIK